MGKSFFAGRKRRKRVAVARRQAANVALKPIEKLPFIVVRKSCHLNQKCPKLSTLLERSTQESSCDFIGELIAGETINPMQKVYGEQHVIDLWREVGER